MPSGVCLSQKRQKSGVQSMSEVIVCMLGLKMDEQCRVGVLDRDAGDGKAGGLLWQQREEDVAATEVPRSREARGAMVKAAAIAAAAAARQRSIAFAGEEELDHARWERKCEMVRVRGGTGSFMTKRVVDDGEGAPAKVL
jgi:hypothetical protein